MQPGPKDPASPGRARPERMDANMKWIGWLAKWAIGALLAAALSVLTTFYMVESYMDALLDRWNLGTLETPGLDVGRLFSLGDRAGTSGLPGSREPAAGFVTDPVKEPAEQVEPWRETNHGRPPGGALKVDAPPLLESGKTAGEHSASGDSGGNSGEAKGGEGLPGGAPGSGEAGGEEGGEPAGTDSMPDAVPVFGHAGLPGALVMSAEEFNEKRKNLSESDKIEIFTILLNHVPQDELQVLSELLEDGITAEEAGLIMDVMEGYLGPKEMDRLLTILNVE